MLTAMVTAMLTAHTVAIDERMRVLALRPGLLIDGLGPDPGLPVKGLAAASVDVRVVELDEDSFISNAHVDAQGKIVNLQAALDHALPLIAASITSWHPDVILSGSKGVSLIAELVHLGQWRGAVLSLSPVINKSTRLEEDDYVGLGAVLGGALPGGCVAFAIGDSPDEAVLAEIGLREECEVRGWRLSVFRGGHRWYDGHMGRMGGNASASDLALLMHRVVASCRAACAPGAG